MYLEPCGAPTPRSPEPFFFLLVELARASAKYRKLSISSAFFFLFVDVLDFIFLSRKKTNYDNLISLTSSNKKHRSNQRHIMRSIFLILTALSGIVAVPLPRNSVGSSFSHQPSVLLAKLLERQTGVPPEELPGDPPKELPGSPREGGGPPLFRENNEQGSVSVPVQTEEEPPLYVVPQVQPAGYGQIQPIQSTTTDALNAATLSSQLPFTGAPVSVDPVIRTAGDISDFLDWTWTTRGDNLRTIVGW